MIGRPLGEMSLRDIEEGGLAFWEAKGRINGELADGPDLEEVDGIAEGDEDRHPCACRDVFLYGPPDDCPACEGSGFVDTPNEWCDACGLTGRCMDCDPDRYRDAQLDR